MYTDTVTNLNFLSCPSFVTARFNINSVEKVTGR